MSLRTFLRRWPSRRDREHTDARLLEYVDRRFRIDGALPIAQARFVVLDTETSGFDVRRDHLLSLAAVGVHAGRIEIADRIELTFARSRVGDASSAIVHQLVTADLEGGVEEREGVLDFLAFLRDGIVVGHHVAFDLAMLDRALLRSCAIRLRNPRLDTLQLHRRLTSDSARSLTPDWPAPLGLDALCEAYGLDLPMRHSSAGDALATAQLFLVLLARARRRGIATVGALLKT